MFLFKRKSIWILSGASLAIVLTGATFSSSSLHQSIYASLMTLLLVLFVYGLDTLSDDLHPMKALLEPEGQTLLLILLSAIVTAAFLPLTSIVCAILILVLGFTYSFPFRLRPSQKPFLLKSVVGVKNLWIGTAWGLGIFLGSGDFASTNSFWAALFVGIQVFIGSTLRDLDDLEEDRARSIHTLPWALGVNRTYRVLHYLNFISGFVLVWAKEPGESWLLFLWGAVFWRILNLEWLRQGTPGIWATQYMNLATCAVILTLRVVSYAVP